MFTKSEETKLNQITNQIFSGTAYIATGRGEWYVEKVSGNFALWHKNRWMVRRKNSFQKQKGYHSHGAYKTIEGVLDYIIKHDGIARFK